MNVISLIAAIVVLAAAVIQYRSARIRREITRLDAEIAASKARTEKMRCKIAQLENEGRQIDADRISAERELEALKAFAYECNMAIIDQLSGFEFEDFVGRLLSHNGYTEITVTPDSGDKGADVIAIAPDGRRTCIQCKHYAKPVGISAVQEVIAAAQYYNCRQTAVITTSSFTRQARELANQTGVFLMDRSYLSVLMENCISECVAAVKDKKVYLDRISQSRSACKRRIFDSM